MDERLGRIIPMVASKMEKWRGRAGKNKLTGEKAVTTLRTESS